MSLLRRSKKRMAKERKTICAMACLYCHSIHGTRRSLCSECQCLLDYAIARLEKCPLKENKPVCSACPVHCYNPEMRGRIREVMRYAGPRMLRLHPILAVHHLLDRRKNGHKK